MLHPFPSATRTVVDLSGIWNVSFDFKKEGEKKKWHKGVPKDRECAVPSSYNDLFTELEELQELLELLAQFLSAQI